LVGWGDNKYSTSPKIAAFLQVDSHSHIVMTLHKPDIVIWMISQAQLSIQMTTILTGWYLGIKHDVNTAIGINISSLRQVSGVYYNWHNVQTIHSNSHLPLHIKIIWKYKSWTLNISKLAKHNSNNVHSSYFWSGSIFKLRFEALIQKIKHKLITN